MLLRLQEGVSAFCEFGSALFWLTAVLGLFQNLNHLKAGITVSPVIINAHDGAIACVAISHNGKTIATASQKVSCCRGHSDVVKTSK